MFYLTNKAGWFLSWNIHNKFVGDVYNTEEAKGFKTEEDAKNYILNNELQDRYSVFKKEN